MNYYDDISSGYDELYGQEQEAKMKLILGLLDVSEEECLLDVGCGSGLSTSKWICKRTGIDLSEQLICIAKKRDPNGTYLVGNAEQLPFKDNEFNYVISVSAIHNFSNIAASLKEMKRVGKDRYIFSVLGRSERFQETLRLIMINFSVQRIIRQEKDIVFVI